MKMTLSEPVLYPHPPNRVNFGKFIDFFRLSFRLVKLCSPHDGYVRMLCLQKEKSSFLLRREPSRINKLDARAGGHGDLIGVSLDFLLLGYN